MAAIGIDLGTTNCCIAYVAPGGKPEVLVNDRGNRTTPSVIDLTGKDIIIGDAARNQMHRYPDSIISDVKYIIGRKYDDPILNNFIHSSLNKIIITQEKTKIMIKEQQYAPEELSAMVLKRLKTFAEDKLGKAVTKAVITVPTYFQDSQRQATIDAGKIAGFQEIKLLNEPVAAATAYGIEHKIKDGRKIIVCDFGGGTFDVSIISAKTNEFKEIGFDGDLNLGGNDIDQKLLQFACKTFDVKVGDKRKLIRLKNVCEKTKIELTNKEVHVLEHGDDNELEITRTEFNEKIKEFLDRLMEVINRCIKNSKLEATQIEEIILVGGSSRIPAFQERVSKFFRKPIKKVINPDEAVATGAAIVAAMWEQIAYQDIKLGLLAPHSIGLELRGKFMRKLILQNSELPFKITCDKIHPDHDGPDVMLRVFCGEDNLTENNNLVGEMLFNNIAVAPDGKRWLVVTFEMNTNCILKVSAEDLAGKRSNMTINVNKGNLTEPEINKYKQNLAKRKIS